jgi:hypothetical protein
MILVGEHGLNVATHQRHQQRGACTIHIIYISNLLLSHKMVALPYKLNNVYSYGNKAIYSSSLTRYITVSKLTGNVKWGQE